MAAARSRLNSMENYVKIEKNQRQVLPGNGRQKGETKWKNRYWILWWRKPMN